MDFAGNASSYGDQEMFCDDQASIEALKVKLKFSDTSKCSNPEATNGF
jgi:hypothetical protein